MRDLLTGRTPIGDRVWDMERILDWAIQNFSVDEKELQSRVIQEEERFHCLQQPAIPV